MTMPAKRRVPEPAASGWRYSDRQRAAFPHPPGGQLHRQRDAARQHRSLDLEGADQTAGHDLGIDRLDTLPDAGGGVAIDDGAVLDREQVKLNGFGQPVGRHGGVPRGREIPVATPIGQDFEGYNRLQSAPRSGPGHGRAGAA